MHPDSQFLKLPEYRTFVDSLSPLDLIISVSELHGLLCGYICAGHNHEGESYIRALLNNKKNSKNKEAIVSLFSVYSISQQQITSFDLEFAMLLPEDEEPLLERAKAFSQWCEGFLQGLTMAGIVIDTLHEEEVQDALQHIVEFGALDCESLDMDEGDEQALMEVTEYTRMAVIRLHNDILLNQTKSGSVGQKH